MSNEHSKAAKPQLCYPLILLCKTTGPSGKTSRWTAFILFGNPRPAADAWLGVPGEFAPTSHVPVRVR